MMTVVVTCKIGHIAERVGEAKNPGPKTHARIAFGNVSSYTRHQNYIKTVPCLVLGMRETWLNDAGFRSVHESLAYLS